MACGSFRSASLEHATLEGANLIAANLQGANCQSSSFVMAQLESASFRDANVMGADFSRSVLLDTVWDNAIYDKKTKWPLGFCPLNSGLVLVEDMDGVPWGQERNGDNEPD